MSEFSPIIGTGKISSCQRKLKRTDDSDDEM